MKKVFITNYTQTSIEKYQDGSTTDEIRNFEKSKNTIITKTIENIDRDELECF